ncbi:hypothetical protein [Guptibacillus algicola]|uniref:hypothetical protein n=1 Tax=Guptibacillus algicola TaxID=225844 RepID=UPI001CD22460|nr:hypothetical protein [Alkalihalobacillus algicola]MCA0988348.1 hypothetical protein [Alkalihalobacillus algicola]
MSKPIEISNIRIEQDKGKDRRAYIANFEEPVQYGVHGGVKDFYNVSVEEEHPSTLDHIVAAAGG